MTDAVTAAPATLLPALPPAGVAPLGRGPGLSDSLPADRAGSASPGQETDPFALILMGFLGAALPASSAPPSPSSALAGSGTGGPAGILAGTQAPAHETPGAPLALPAEGAPSNLPDQEPAGKPLPVTGEDLPASAADAGLPDAVATPLPGPRNGPRGNLAELAHGDGTLDPREGTGQANPRGAAMDTLLAELALGRAALRGTPPPATNLTGADPMEGLPAPTELRALAGEPPTAVLESFNLASPSTTGGGSIAVQTTAGTASILAGNLAAGQRTGGPGPAAPGGSALTPLGDSASFATGLGERLVAMGRDGLHTARLRLHPESLGTLEVRIRVDAGLAEVWFGTGQADARDAIEGTLPRLREMFATQGIDLGRVQVELRPEPGAAPGWQPGGGLGAGDQRNPGRDPDSMGSPATTTPRPPWADGAAASTVASSRQRLLDVLA